MEGQDEGKAGGCTSMSRERQINDSDRAGQICLVIAIVAFTTTMFIFAFK